MTLLRYDLDRLGWLEFERLAQAILKQKLGLGIEAWGGRSDAGRDAYYDGELTYPSPRREAGPFVFQAKFIEGANAAGAQPAKALRAAVVAEARLIRTRQTKLADLPRHYALLTNAHASPDDRAFIRKKTKDVLPNVAVHVHDGTDVCAWLDSTPDLLQVYPHIAGLTQIIPLLKHLAGAALVNRSKAAIREAEAIAEVFVTTHPYNDARILLQEHAFVVIVGPPEVGKTAIGRMLALAAIARGWEAVECVWPSDFHDAYAADEPQLFLADDFFGRSEYDTRIGSEWLRELPRALSMLDERHHLVFTTRRHLLSMLKEELDLSGRARHFPQPSELAIDAGELDRIEKAKILYRHAKARLADKDKREFIRTVASEIIDDPHFTPERIRRLVEDQSLHFVMKRMPDPSRLDAQRVAREALARPTDGMRTTFRRLPVAHRWMLFALAETESSARLRYAKHDMNSTKAAYERLCPVASLEPFEDVLAAMDHTFVIVEADQKVRWVHPSARDLVIAELARNANDRGRFLRCANGQGLALATSVGGDDGARHFPLLQSESDWKTLIERMTAMASTSPLDLEAVFANELIAERFDARVRTVQQRLRAELVALWPLLIKSLNTADGWTGEMLRHCARHHDPSRSASLVLDGFARRSLTATHLTLARGSNTVFWQRDFGIDEVIEDRRAIESVCGSFGRVESHIRAILDCLLGAVEEELDASYSDRDLTRHDHDEYQQQCDSLASQLNDFDELVGAMVSMPERRRLKAVCANLGEMGRDHAEPEQWRPDSASPRVAQAIDQDVISIELLFADL